MILVLLALLAAPLSATIADRTKDMEKSPGFLTYYWDAKAGKVWLEIDRWNQEFLYYLSLPAGIGSNDIGLDRGRLGGQRVVKFTRVGPKALLIQPNYAFRALTSDADERRAVEESFAQSVFWGFEIVEMEGDRALVDATAFFLRDAYDAAGWLRRQQQGVFRFDASRSAFHLPRTRNFPKNTEVEVTVTLTADDPGPLVASVTPTPGAVTVRQHHSFVELPGAGYRPRAFDPRAGYFGGSFMDYSTPISEPIVKRFASRHRLEKRDPRAATSDPVKPIIYYLDRGTPEPIRSALLEGARWWNQAFEAAGYRNAFRVELMPEGADAMDVRYNVIQWVHRSTRGWSYGSSVSDPRTGEIIKGHVTLGSLRVRQDFLIAEGLLAPYERGQPADPRMQQMALARLRQLSAHEVGHTLGLQHNYIASTANRASVMDYPHPLVKLTAAGEPDISDAYAAGIGEWDKVAIRWGYQHFPEGANERAELDGILTAARARGILFLTDQDARPPGSAHPATHLWDSNANAVDELERVIRIRAAALSRFGERNIRERAPLASLEDVLVPMYLFHRYQAEAAAKVVGGLEYTYALRGDGQKATAAVSGKEQRRALEALLRTIQPPFLQLPESLLALIPPRPVGYGRNREAFRIRTGMTFDPLAAAETAAHHTIGLLLNADRAARLVEYSARDRSLPGLAEVLDRLLAATWKAPRLPGLAGEIQRTVDNVALFHLAALAANERASGQARAMASLKIEQLRRWMAAAPAGDESQRAHFHFALATIKKFQEDPKPLAALRPLEPPDGQPIGDCDWGWDN
jgi:hypothetical protein